MVSGDKGARVVVVVGPTGPHPRALSRLSRLSASGPTGVRASARLRGGDRGSGRGDGSAPDLLRPTAAATRCAVVAWHTWVGRVHATVDRYRCRRTCGTERRVLLDQLEVEPGRPSGWLARPRR